MITINLPLFHVWSTKEDCPACDTPWIALNEEWARGLIYCDMEGWYVSKYGEIALLDECGSCRWPEDGYELRWNLDALKELVEKLEAGDAE